MTITGHDAADDGDAGLHRFHFQVVEGEPEPRLACVTLRTARVFGKELARHTALDALMRAIANAAPEDYDCLVGKSFRDN
ncbi:hypothetical protein A9R05_21370 [Burkholderia sp. KK1]|nr:hypothetical protein A9R05_21370 [Burkholderia sp. KK1]